MSTTRHNVLPRRNDRLRKLQTVIAITLTLIVLAPSAVAQEPEKYLLLATYRTGTMQDELNETGARGYRFAGAQIVGRRVGVSRRRQAPARARRR